MKVVSRENGPQTVAGVDAGMVATKAVVLTGSNIRGCALAAGGKESTAMLARLALERAAEKAGVSLGEVRHIVATGKGRKYVDLAQEKASETWCLAQGIAFLLPTVRTVLDVGGQKCLAVRCDHGEPVQTAISDKCAAGSGRYLELVASILGVRMEEMGELASRSKAPVEVESVCAVFAESEIISLVHLRHQREDILMGVLGGLARRIYPLLVEVGMEREVAAVGGVARNIGLMKALEEVAGFKLLVPDHPEMVGALGAALMAQRGRSNAR